MTLRPIICAGVSLPSGSSTLGASRWNRRGANAANTAQDAGTTALLQPRYWPRPTSLPAPLTRGGWFSWCVLTVFLIFFPPNLLPPRFGAGLCHVFLVAALRCKLSAVWFMPRIILTDLLETALFIRHQKPSWATGMARTDRGNYASVRSPPDLQTPSATSSHFSLFS